MMAADPKGGSEEAKMLADHKAADDAAGRRGARDRLHFGDDADLDRVGGVRDEGAREHQGGGDRPYARGRGHGGHRGRCARSCRG